MRIRLRAPVSLGKTCFLHAQKYGTKMGKFEDTTAQIYPQDIEETEVQNHDTSPGSFMVNRCVFTSLKNKNSDYRPPSLGN